MSLSSPPPTSMGELSHAAPREAAKTPKMPPAQSRKGLRAGAVPIRSVLWPTGHIDHLAGNERSVVADQERDHTGDVFRLTRPAHRDLRSRALDEVIER